MTPPSSRKIALKTGDLRYFTGRPCLRGHVSERYTKNGRCTRCHIDVIKSRRTLYRNSESGKARRKAYRNSESGKASAFKTMAKRRKRGLDNVPPWANGDKIAEMYIEAKRSGMTVDHVIPLIHPLVCGLHVESNLQLLTMEENAKKGNTFTV